MGCVVRFLLVILSDYETVLKIMRYSIIFLVVVGLISNCLLTKFINGEHLLSGPYACPWEVNGCGSPFECFALALTVVILFRNLTGQRNIRPTKTTRITTRITTTPKPACPAGYFLFAESCGRFCYRFESSDCRIWANAREKCREERGDLLAPSECNYQFFRVRAQKNEGSCPTNFWLGAERPPNGDAFRTVEGSLISNRANFWQPDQPDNDGGVENCLEMRKEYSNYLANDNICTRPHGYICKIMI